MELIFAGLFVVISALLSNQLKKYGDGELDSSSLIFDRQYGLMAAFGCFLIVIGVVGILSGVYKISFAKRETLTLGFLILVINFQARLVLYARANPPDANYFSSKDTNLIEIIRKAVSVGFFPKGSAICWFVCFTQVAILFILLFLFN